MSDRSSDDPEFLRRVSELIEGVLLTAHKSEAWIIKLDNWFDHKWLGFFGHGPYSANCSLERLRLPSFHPNRILSENYISFDTETLCYVPNGGKPLHPQEFTGVEPWLDTITTSGAMFWFSSNSEMNGRGSLMVYLLDEESSTAWYVAFERKHTWNIVHVKGISTAEITEFEEVMANESPRATAAVRSCTGPLGSIGPLGSERT